MLWCIQVGILGQPPKNTRCFQIVDMVPIFVTMGTTQKAQWREWGDESQNPRTKNRSYIYVCVCVYIYIYIERERERERERIQLEFKIKIQFYAMCLNLCGITP